MLSDISTVVRAPARSGVNTTCNRADGPGAGVADADADVAPVHSKQASVSATPVERPANLIGYGYTPVASPLAFTSTSKLKRLMTPLMPSGLWLTSAIWL